MEQSKTRIYLTGRVMIETPEGVYEASAFPGRQGRLAFVYLASTSRRVDRAELAGLLWPETVPQTWDTSLSAIISKLRKLLEQAGLNGHQTLNSMHGSYELRAPPGTWIDLRYAINALDRAEGALRRGRVKEAWADAGSASAIFRRSFLAGETGPWVEDMRRRLHDMQVRAFDVVAGALLADGQAGAAVHTAREAVNLAPYRESGYARLMECLIEAGDRAEALRVYDELASLLRDTLGVSPTPDVEELYERALG